MIVAVLLTVLVAACERGAAGQDPADRPPAAATALPAATAAPAASEQPAAPAIVRDPAFRPLAGATARFGRYSGGAYRIEVPDNWNGGLVMYAHGYRGEGATVYVSDPPIRAHLISLGYAWAASSYRANGYRPDYGVDDTLALRDIFIEEVGQPRWTILEGSSMGGHVLTSSLELHPSVYQGGLAECGAMTGIGVIDYLTAYAAAAEYISGVTLFDLPDAGAFSRAVNGPWLAEMGRPGSYTEKGQRFDSVVKHLTGGDLPFREEGLAVVYTANLQLLADPTAITRLPGRAAATQRLRYQIDPALGLSAEELNAGVRRFSAAAGSRMAAENPVFADLTGRIRVPVLSLHTTGDAFVPFSLEQDYRRKVESQGAGDLLVQRAIRRPLHCQFNNNELTRAFDDLVAWIEQGIRPAGDDVLAADLSQIGLQWTAPLLQNDPANR